MKAKFIGASALVLAVALAACGGKSGFTINGTIYDGSGAVSNLRNPGLVLANGDDQVSVPVGASSFSFGRQIEYGDDYNVVVKTQPQHMTCSPTSITGTAGRTESINIALTCTQNAYSVYVTINGLTGDNLQLINGSSGGITVLKTDTKVEFKSIPVGVSYGIEIFNQPSGQTCTIANGTGIMGDAHRDDAVVTCVKNP